MEPKGFKSRDQTPHPENLGQRVIRYVDCGNSFIWDDLNPTSNLTDIERDTEVFTRAIRTPDQSKENALATPNALKVGEIVRLPRGFSLKKRFIKAYKLLNLKHHLNT